jgi:dTDP-4-dehydrorhamnose 3,5-epimerase
VLRDLAMHKDARGAVTEIFRAEWGARVEPIQWNTVVSSPRVLRGVHLHLKHSDYLLLLQGRMSLGLVDLRSGSATERLACSVELTGERLTAVEIPPGVAHGFYYHEQSIHIYAVDHYWDLADELGCYWADPELGLAWPEPEAIVSERDGCLPPLSVLIKTLEGVQF